MKPRTMMRIGSVLVALLVAFAPAAARADNLTPGTAAWLTVNGGGHEARFFLSNTITERWYLLFLQGGRSYCFELGRDQVETEALDSEMQLYGPNSSSTLIASNDDNQVEPPRYLGSRICFRPTLAGPQVYYLKAISHTSLASCCFDYYLRVVETTLFSPYFAVGGGYDAAPQIRNNTSNTINVYFTAYNNSGTPLGCPAGATAIPANGMTTFGVSSFCGTTSAFGSAAIAHDGPPGAITANITTFSGGSGLSFDAAFAPRQDY